MIFLSVGVSHNVHFFPSAKVKLLVFLNLWAFFFFKEWQPFQFVHAHRCVWKVMSEIILINSGKQSNQTLQMGVSGVCHYRNKGLNPGMLAGRQWFHQTHSYCVCLNILFNNWNIWSSCKCSQKGILIQIKMFLTAGFSASSSSIAFISDCF